MPARCVSGDVGRAGPVAFVANGRAWALDLGGRLQCLFRARDAGPFAWGPRGDRALLAHLEVKAIYDAPKRPPSIVEPLSSSWGRPIGKSIVFVGRGGRALLKAHPDGGGFTDVTPMRGVRYRRVLYHPSGLAFAFVLRRGGRESLWISSNRGLEPRMLVHGKSHTAFGALAFGRRGTVLYFAARHADGKEHVHSLPLLDPDFAPVEWAGDAGEHVSDVFAGSGSDLALTIGRSCESRRAVIVTAKHPGGADALPDARTSRAVGWIDDRHVLVAAGGCSEKLDLYAISTASLDARLLVRAVGAASVRRAEELPPPPLPGHRGKPQAVA